MEVKNKQKLVDAVIEQVKKDVEIGDFTSLEELFFHFVPDVNLLNYLPEEEQGAHK